MERYLLINIYLVWQINDNISFYKSSLLTLLFILKCIDGVKQTTVIYSISVMK